MKVILISGKAEHGKDTFAGYAKSYAEANGKKAVIIHYADLVKYIARSYFDWDGNKDEKGRTLLQEIGTERFRTKYPNFWVDFVGELLTCCRDKWDLVFIPDCRFPNEIDLGQYKFNKTHIRIIRDNYENSLTAEQRLHPSETALDDAKADITVHNTTLGALASLAYAITEMLISQ